MGGEGSPGNIFDPGIQDSFTLDVVWGDGKSDSFSLVAGSTEFSFRHRYLDDDNDDQYDITATVIDDDGGSDPTLSVASTTVTVTNLLPALEEFGPTSLE